MYNKTPAAAIELITTDGKQHIYSSARSKAKSSAYFRKDGRLPEVKYIGVDDAIAVAGL